MQKYQKMNLYYALKGLSKVSPLSAFNRDGELSQDRTTSSLYERNET